MKNQYKYRLNDLLRKMTVEDYEKAREFLPAHLGIHSTTLSDWRYIREGNPREIPSAALIKLADFFNLQPAELFTTPLKSTREAFENHINQ